MNLTAGRADSAASDCAFGVWG